MIKKQKGVFEYLGKPGIVSMMGLGAGWLAVILLLQNEPFFAIMSAITAFFIDCLDGYVARKFRLESEFGRQLDGSFDFFNYLVFSSLLFWMYISPNLLGVFVGFLILATGAFRLIRFNIEGFIVKDKQLYYPGIVVCFVSLTTVVLFYLQQFFPQLVAVIGVPAMIVVSLLQVSRIPVKKTNTYRLWLSVAFILFLIAGGLQVWSK